MSLEQRWNDTCADVSRICEESGRNPHDVKIIAVSKTVEPPVVGEAIACGVTDFGENRDKPFNEKVALYPQARWHFIGTLQSNKARHIVGKAFLIHSLDRASLLEAIEKAADNVDCIQDVLIEVSVSGEKSKGGIRPDELPAFIERIAQCEHVACKGLMTMAPRGDMDLARKTFAGLQNLSQMMSKYCDERDSISMSELSMGMSEDYPVAIEEGATMVRIGRRIFDDNFRAL
ncbi:MAG: YggS family pyridoxal phosphate-dependent enzyme [Coriobacteriales bacterium]